MSRKEVCLLARMIVMTQIVMYHKQLNATAILLSAVICRLGAITTASRHTNVAEKLFASYNAATLATNTSNHIQSELFTFRNEMNIPKVTLKFIYIDLAKLRIH